MEKDNLRIKPRLLPRFLPFDEILSHQSLVFLHPFIFILLSLLWLLEELAKVVVSISSLSSNVTLEETLSSSRSIVSDVDACFFSHSSLLEFLLQSLIEAFLFCL
ncbi:hypothetical protein V8G54_007700 [Vigna mungo]|uniref:Uncharacterized protein n=1 Tax=Vigna mungo TaxID=3915 RepID=A0AAQ3P5Y1_VIGMU